MLRNLHTGVRRCSSCTLAVRAVSTGVPVEAHWHHLKERLRLCDTPSLCDADKTIKPLSRALQPRHGAGRGIKLIGRARTVRAVCATICTCACLTYQVREYVTAVRIIHSVSMNIW
jgi:hypothetical protein